MSETENVTLNLDPGTRVLRQDMRVLRDEELESVSGGRRIVQFVVPPHELVKK